MAGPALGLDLALAAWWRNIAVIDEVIAPEGAWVRTPGVRTRRISVKEGEKLPLVAPGTPTLKGGRTWHLRLKPEPKEDAPVGRLQIG